MNDKYEQTRIAPNSLTITSSPSLIKTKLNQINKTAIYHRIVNCQMMPNVYTGKHTRNHRKICTHTYHRTMATNEAFVNYHNSPSYIRTKLIKNLANFHRNK